MALATMRGGSNAPDHIKQHFLRFLDMVEEKAAEMAAEDQTQ